MKVWVVSEYAQDGYSEVVGVYTSEQRAQQAVKEWSRFCSVREHELVDDNSHRRDRRWGDKRVHGW
jgi:hypothetical protein